MSCVNIFCTIWEKRKFWITKKKDDDDVGEMQK